MLDKFNYKEALNATEFSAQTLSQLHKDLDRAQCSTKLTLENLIEDLASLLENLSDEKRAQLLYLIDLPENNTSIQTTGNFFVDLAEQIIHREALKVYWRQRFSSP